MGNEDGEKTAHFSIKQVLEAEGEKASRLSIALVAVTGSAMGKSFRLEKPVNILGRNEQADIRIDEEGVSRRHAQVTKVEDAWILTDLRSTNGTMCNGIRVSKPTQLHEGDRIRLASTILRFETTDELAEEMRAKLYDQATRDPLTGAYNRLFLKERLNGEWAWSARHARPCSAIAIDIDHFKRVNDTWGHPAGDYVLKEIVTIMQRSMRHEDVLARYGGEEFVVLCRATAVEEARVVAERVRGNVQTHQFVWEGSTIGVTISVGIASSDSPNVTSAQSLLSVADAQLYRAKELGRNRVESG